MKPVAFEYCRPDSIAEAVALLEGSGRTRACSRAVYCRSAHAQHAPGAAGALIDVKRVQGMDSVVAQGAEIRTGATLRQAAAMRDAGLMQSVPLLCLSRCACRAYRRATAARWVFGRDADRARRFRSRSRPWAARSSSSPSAARGALRAREFFVDVLTTARASDELLTGLLWPMRRANAVMLSTKFASATAILPSSPSRPRGRVDRCERGAGAPGGWGWAGWKAGRWLQIPAAFLGRRAEW